MRKMRGGSCLIVLGGDIADAAAVKKAARTCAEIICADGAVKHAAKLGFRADFVVGDMDSLPQRLPAWRGVIYWCDFNENQSDFEKCLTFARGRGFKHVLVVGAIGGRLDHTLVNLALAERAAKVFEMTLLGGGRFQVLGPGKYSFPMRPGAIFSLLAAPAAKISLSGCRYPLKRAVLERTSRGLSNKASGRLHLQVHSGRLWFCIPNF